MLWTICYGPYVTGAYVIMDQCSTFLLKCSRLPMFGFSPEIRVSGQSCQTEHARSCSFIPDCAP